MTAAEQASLEALRSEVAAGFSEVRALMESRRVEEVRVQDQLVARLAVVEANSHTNKVLIRLGGWVVATIIAAAAIAIRFIGG